MDYVHSLNSFSSRIYVCVYRYFWLGTMLLLGQPYSSSYGKNAMVDVMKIYVSPYVSHRFHSISSANTHQDRSVRPLLAHDRPEKNPEL